MDETMQECNEGNPCPDTNDPIVRLRCAEKHRPYESQHRHEPIAPASNDGEQLPLRHGSFDERLAEPSGEKCQREHDKEAQFERATSERVEQDARSGNRN